MITKIAVAATALFLSLYQGCNATKQHRSAPFIMLRDSTSAIIIRHSADERYQRCPLDDCSSGLIATYEWDVKDYDSEGKLSVSLWERLTVNGQEVFHMNRDLSEWYAPGWNAAKVNRVVKWTDGRIPPNCINQPSCI